MKITSTLVSVQAHKNNAFQPCVWTVDNYFNCTWNQIIIIHCILNAQIKVSWTNVVVMIPRSHDYVAIPLFYVFHYFITMSGKNTLCRRAKWIQSEGWSMGHTQINKELDYCGSENRIFLFGSCLCLELQSKWFWHLWWWWSWKSKGDLDTIVDEPLKGSQCTDHNDTGSKTLPDTLWSHFFQD